MKHEFKIKIIERFDNYYSEINNKGAFLLTFNTFIFGSLLIGYKDLSEFINCFEKSIFDIILGITFLMSITSMTLTIFAIIPYLTSKKSDDKLYKSIMFFKNIAESKQIDYLTLMNNLNESDIDNELNIQIHNLSKGLDYKHKLVRAALMVNLFQLFFLIPIIILILN